MMGPIDDLEDVYFDEPEDEHDLLQGTHHYALTADLNCENLPEPDADGVPPQISVDLLMESFLVTRPNGCESLLVYPIPDIIGDQFGITAP